MLAEYAAYLPLTIRQVFYRLVGNFSFDKTERAYDRLAVWLPSSAGHSYGRGCDPRRWQPARRLELHETVTQRLPALVMPDPDVADSYRLDPDGQPQRIEVWAEAAGMVPMLSQVTQPYGVSVYSSSCFDSTTFKRAASLRAADTPEQVPLVVLHIGDHDPSGVHLSIPPPRTAPRWRRWTAG